LLDPETSGPSSFGFEFDTVVSPLSAVRNRSEDTKKASSPKGYPLVDYVKMQKKFLGEDAKEDKKRDGGGTSLGDRSDAKGRRTSALPYPNPEPHGIMVVPDYRRSSKELTQSSALWFV